MCCLDTENPIFQKVCRNIWTKLEKIAYSHTYCMMLSDRGCCSVTLQNFYFMSWWRGSQWFHQYLSSIGPRSRTCFIRRRLWKQMSLYFNLKKRIRDPVCIWWFDKYLCDGCLPDHQTASLDVADKSAFIYSGCTFLRFQTVRHISKKCSRAQLHIK